MTNHLNNAFTLKPFRKKLRKESTLQEILLWSKLRSSQLGVKFRRQHSFGPFILDFYCPSRELAIELDGSQHAEEGARDAERTAYLRKFKIRVLRFWNNEVTTNMDGVLHAISDAVNDTPPQPSPSQGRELPAS